MAPLGRHHAIYAADMDIINPNDSIPFLPFNRIPIYSQGAPSTISLFGSWAGSRNLRKYQRIYSDSYREFKSCTESKSYRVNLKAPRTLRNRDYLQNRDVRFLPSALL